jgi:GNAT superfamily N-acetyltransferase
MKSTVKMNHDSKTAADVRIETLTARRFPQKAELHALTWHETYQGMIPQGFVDMVTPEFALAVTRRHDPSRTLLALQDDEPIGFAEFLDEAGPDISTPEVSELGALYVLGEVQHQGVGKMLLHAALDAMPRRYAALSVVLKNANAIAFYEHMGFHSTGHISLDDFDTPILEMTNATNVACQ